MEQQIKFIKKSEFLYYIFQREIAGKAVVFKSSPVNLIPKFLIEESEIGRALEERSSTHLMKNHGA